MHNFFWYHYKKNGKLEEACVIRGYGKNAIIHKPEEIYIASNTYYHKQTKLGDDLQLYGQKVVNYRIRNGYLTSSDAIFLASEILDKNPIISELIVRRYPYIIVDEAQDTSEDQHKLIEKLCKAGLKNLELIGDINQSIYEWRFARPDILETFTRNPNWNHVPFVNNRRSVQRIIDLYSKSLVSR